MGIVPDSPLAHLLAKLNRHDRRLLLAALTAADGPRRDKLQREFKARAKELGL
jgi:hypothetical protein